MNTQKLVSAVLTFLLLLLAVITIFPIFWMCIMATQSTQQIYQGVSFVPGGNFMINYRSVADVRFDRAFLNSLLVAAPTVIVSVVVSAMAGYALSKFRFRARGAVLGVVLAIMLVPNEVSIVAYVMEMRMLRLANTLAPLVLLNLAHAFGVFFMTQYMTGGVPYEILESCRIDGCSEPRIFFEFVLPIVRPALFTLGVIVFMLSWNNYMYPLVLINKAEMYTAPLAIASIGTRDTPMYGAKALGVVLGIAPLLLAFIAFSKVITEGLTEGSVKG